MAIQKNAKGTGGSFIKEAGDYLVHIVKTTMKLSKAKDPMVVVTFETEDEKMIDGYFVGKHAFHQHNMRVLKEACGLKETDKYDQLVGKKCGISVELQDPDQLTGRVFAQIVGYGPLSDLGGGKAAIDERNPPPPTDFDRSGPYTDEVPF